MTTENKKIAVLLASYNGEKFIAQQIESILNQDVDNPIQLFIRDDGSTDNTVSIIKEMAKKDGRITLIQSENIGGVACFFALLKMAHDLPDEYEYFSLSDQDDVWDLDKLKIAIEAIKSKDTEKPVLYGSTTRPVNQNLEPISFKKSKFKPFVFYNTIIQIKIPGHTHVMNRALLNIVFNANPNEIYGHDAFIVNAANISGYLIYDDHAHVSYRQHGGNQLGTSKTDKSKWIQNHLKRIESGAGKQYGRQIEYIVKCFENNMTPEQKCEMRKFLDCRYSFWKRLLYICHSKLYRQTIFETYAFKLLYLFGGYNTK